MNSYKVLLKVQLLSSFGFNRFLHSTDKKDRRNCILMGAVYGVLFLMGTFYSIAIAYGCQQMGMTDLLPSLTLMVSAVLTIIVTFMKTNGILFGMKDYDMVMSLPVPVPALLLSRLTAVYFMNLAASAIAMLPSVIVYGLEHQSSPGGWFIMIVSVFLAPLLPMVLSAVASTLILSAALRFKYRNLATILLSVGAVLLVVGASFRMQNMNAEDFAAIGQAAAQQVNAVYPPAALLSGALNHGSILYFLYFVLLSLGSTGLFLLLLSLSFAKLNTALFSHHTRGAYKMQRLGTASPLAAIYKKELRRLMSSSIYLLNTSVGEILLLVLSVLFLFTDQGQLRDLLGGYGIILEFSRSIPFVISLFMIMSCTTCASISLEGKARWCLFTAPVAPGTIFLAKIGVNLTLMLPAAGIAGILFVIHFRPDPLTGIFFFLTPAAYAFFTAVLGLALDLKYPRYDWATEYHAVKQGLPVLATIGAGMLMVLPPLAVTFLLSSWALPVTVCFTLLAGGGAWYLYRRISCFFSSNLLQ